MRDRYSRNEWAFCGTIIGQAVLILALEFYILAQWQIWVTPIATQVQASYLVPVDIAIVIFACLYTAVLSVDAIYCKNNILLLAICINNCLILAFSAMQYREILEVSKRLPLARDMFGNTLVDVDRDIWSYVQPAELIADIVIGVCTPPAWFFAYQIHKEYKWVIYRRIHGDTIVKVRYLAYEVFLVLTKLNFFFSVGFIIQYNLVDVHFDEPEYSLTMALIPVILLVLLLGIWFVRAEKLCLMIGIIICYLAFVAYFLSRIIVLCGKGRLANTSGRDKMLLFAISALTFTFSSFVCAVQCVFNFGHGLKSVITDSGRLDRGSYQFHTISSPISERRDPGFCID